MLLMENYLYTFFFYFSQIPSKSPPPDFTLQRKSTRRGSAMLLSTLSVPEPR